MFSKNPGPVPRQIAAKDLLKRLPAMTQYFVIVPAILMVVGLVLGMFGNWPIGVGCIVLSGLVLDLHAALAWSHCRKLIHYPAALGRVIGFTNPDDFNTCHLAIVHFDFQVDDVVYSGEQNVGIKLDLRIGSPLWILYNPRRPTDAIPWLD